MTTQTDSDDISLAELRELAIAAKQQIEREKKARGGRYPNSFRQKAVAAETIRETRPWEKSTGPTSPAGKARSSRNGSYFAVLEYSARSEAELESIVAPVREGLMQFREKMNRLGLGIVRLTSTSKMKGVSKASIDKCGIRALATMTPKDFDIVFSCEVTFKVRVSRYKAENRAAIEALFHECMSGI